MSGESIEESWDQPSTILYELFGSILSLKLYDAVLLVGTLMFGRERFKHIMTWSPLKAGTT